MFKWFTKRNVVVKEPVLGFLDLSGGGLAHYIQEDKSAFGCFFTSVVESDQSPPKCDVLFAYGDIEVDGKVRRTALELREIIHISGAKMVVFASRNENGHYTRALKRKGSGRANIVLTCNRKANAFAKFFCNLFTEMQNGTTMPVAWVKFAPQGLTHADCPDTIMLCEVGQLAFCA